jgi:hypothetical protein
LEGKKSIAQGLQNCCLSAKSTSEREKLRSEIVFAYSDSFEQFEIRLSHNTMQRKSKKDIKIATSHSTL